MPNVYDNGNTWGPSIPRVPSGATTLLDFAAPPINTTAQPDQFVVAEVRRRRPRQAGRSTEPL
jgi:hypothetical protein